MSKKAPAPSDFDRVQAAIMKDPMPKISIAFNPRQQARLRKLYRDNPGIVEVTIEVDRFDILTIHHVKVKDKE